jgi:hypothetical protein
MRYHVHRYVDVIQMLQQIMCDAHVHLPADDSFRKENSLVVEWPLHKYL